MGINGLLKVLETIANDRHLSSYKGQRIAVDGYCWLHKSVYLLTDEILYNPNSKKYLIYLIRRLEQLLKYNITPIIIFDGDKLPMKKQEEEERSNHRREVIQKTIMLLDQGLRKEAQAKLIEGIDISPLIAFEFIQELKKRNIEYIVAPYEADAQLAYLSKINYVDCVITEDSDLIALECKKVLYKLDFENDMGKEIVYSDIKKCKEYSFELYDNTKFLTFCILSGCDYFKLKGVGTKSAYNATKNQSSYKESLLLLKDKKDNITKQTVIDFEKAFISFKHQVIYCPLEKSMKYMNSIESSEYEFIYKYLDDLSFLGRMYEGEVTKRIVYGEIDPITHKPLIIDPSKSALGLPMKINSQTLKEHFNITSKYTPYKRTYKYPSNSCNNNDQHSSYHKAYGAYSHKKYDSNKGDCDNKVSKMPNSNDKYLQKKRERNIDLFDKEFFLDIELDIRNNNNPNHETNPSNSIYGNHKRKSVPEAKQVDLSSDSIVSIHSSDSISKDNNKSPLKANEDSHFHKISIRKVDNEKKDDDDDDNSLNELEDFDAFLTSYTMINDKLKNGHINPKAKIMLKDNIVSITEEEENGKEIKQSVLSSIPNYPPNGNNIVSFFEQFKYNPNE